MPDDWYVAITDVKGSTKAIEAGRYKDVNLQLSPKLLVTPSPPSPLPKRARGVKSKAGLYQVFEVKAVISASTIVAILNFATIDDLCAWLDRADKTLLSDNIAITIQLFATHTSCLEN